MRPGSPPSRHAYGHIIHRRPIRPVLIPLYAVGNRRALVVFQVAQHGGVNGDMHVVALVWSYRHKTCSEGEAMQVAADIAVHICEFMQIEVIGCGERKVPRRRWLDIS